MNAGVVPRLVTVWCPDWPVVAARVAPGQPAAVFHANRVVARSPAAIAAGVLPGERRRSAQGTCPELLVIDHDPDRDARAFEPIIRAIAEMAPRLEVVEPGWVCLSARGPSRYFGGDQAMAERMVEIVHDTTGARAGVGVADGRAAAAIAARRAARTPTGVVVIPPGGSPGSSPRCRSPGCASWARSTAELVDLFVRLGLRTFGQLGHLGRRRRPGPVRARRACTPIASPAVPTRVPPLHPILRPSGGSRRPSSNRSSSSRRWSSSRSDSPTPWSHSWRPRVGCASGSWSSSRPNTVSAASGRGTGTRDCRHTRWSSGSAGSSTGGSHDRSG